MNSQTSYPLSWPPGWPRTPFNRRVASRFSVTRPDAPNRSRTLSESIGGITREIDSLGSTHLVISTNVPLRLDGSIDSRKSPNGDPGAAVYFKLKGKAVSLACDKWLRVEDNIWAIAKHIEALRGQDRWGVGSVEQAFAGYLRLPAPGESGAPTWWAVLGCAHNAPLDVVRDAYRAKARIAHPDNGGSNEAMSVLNRAWDQARQAFGST